MAARLRVAQLLAFLALLAALVGALGPAERVRTSYSWPPKTLPAETPDRAWYTPLLLIKHRPQALSASIPCTLPPALPAAGQPLRVLASARRPERADALALTRAGATLRVAVGERTLARVPLPRVRAPQGCAYRLRMEGERWSLSGGPAEISREGALEAPPVVFGLFSGLDLRAGEPPRVEVLTAVHETRTIPRQALAWTLAALAIAAALALLAFERRPRPGRALRRAGRALRANAHPVDAVVAVVLLFWWIFSPAFFDDGWIFAKQSMFEASRGFSTYYVMLGTNAPLGYWLDWLQHWLAQETSALVLLRLPALACLAATWVLCRYVLVRVLAGSPGASRVALWSLASAFCVGALAWGMTLRPEPVTALLVTGVLACCVRFLERPSAAPLALACVLFPLALTAHPAGLVALAPLLAIGRTLLRSARRHIPAIATGATVIAAEFLLLGFVGADLEQRRLDTQTIRTLGGSTESSLNELRRYDLLAVAPYSPPLRRALVALIALAVIAFALRRFFREGRGVLDLPATSLAIGLVLLIATPSKWPSHFGTFIGIAAIAVAAEMAALRTDTLRRGVGPLRPLLVIAFAGTAIAWSWNVRGAWNQGDLRTLDWTPGFESWLPLNVVAAALPLLLLGIAVVRGLLERRSVALAHVAAQAGALLALPLIVFTGVMLVVDAARTDSWTMGRQNLGTLVDEAGCGLADEMLIPGDSVAAGPEPLTRRLATDGAPSLVLPNLLMYFPCAHLPRLTNGIAEVPQQIVSYPNPQSPIRYPVTSPWVGLLDIYGLEPLTGRDPPQDFLAYGVERDIPGAILAEVLPASAS